MLAVIGPSWPFRSGIARYTTELAFELNRQNQLAGFFSPYRQYPKAIFPGKSDRDREICRKLSFSHQCYAPLEPWSWPALSRKVDQSKADSIVLPYWSIAHWPVHAFVQKKLQRPIVTILHNAKDHEDNPLARGCASQAIDRASALFCHCRDTFTDLKKKHPKKRLGFHPLPPLTEKNKISREAARAKLGLKTKELALLFFGIIRPYKGLFPLLKTLSEIPKDIPIRLLIAGEAWNPSREEIEREIKRLELSDRCLTKLEWIAESEVETWFRASDAALLPYLSSYGSSVAAQALQYRIPVIASSLGSFSDIIREGKNGILTSDFRKTLIEFARTPFAPTFFDHYSMTSYAEALLDLTEGLA